MKHEQRKLIIRSSVFLPHLKIPKRNKHNKRPSSEGQNFFVAFLLHKGLKTLIFCKRFFTVATHKKAAKSQ
jgi:hypothetical protein